MPTLFVRHTVGDYAAWRRVYDEADALRREAGVTSHGVYQRLDAPNDITVYHEFATLEAARAFLDRPELQVAMQRAGVQGAPEVWLTNRV